MRFIGLTLLVACSPLPEIVCDFETDGVCVRRAGLPTDEEIRASITGIIRGLVKVVAPGWSFDRVVRFHEDHRISLSADNERVENEGEDAQAVTRFPNSYSEFQIILRDDYSVGLGHYYLLHEFLHIYSYMLYGTLDPDHINEGFFDISTPSTAGYQVYQYSLRN